MAKKERGDLNVSSNQTTPTSNKNFAGIIITISILANVIILLLFFAPSIGYKGDVTFDITVLPRFNAVFNSFTFIFLLHEFVVPEYNLTWPEGYMILVQVTI